MEQLDVEKQELNRMTSQLTTRLYEHKVCLTSVNAHIHVYVSLYIVMYVYVYVV